MKTYTLQPGVRCHLIHDARFKTIQLSVLMQMPLTTSAATATSLLARYLQRGTQRYPQPRQLRMALEQAYGAATAIGAVTLGQRSVLTAGLSCLSDRYAPGNGSVVMETVNILREQLSHPRQTGGVFDPGQFNEAQHAHRVQLEQLIDDKVGYAQLQCAQRMARPGETFAIHPLGSLADLDALAPGPLWETYQRIRRTSQIDVFVFGEIEEDAALAAVGRLLEKIERGQPVALSQGTAGCPDCITLRDEEEVMDVEQGRLVIGYRRPVAYSPEALARNGMFLNIFGVSDQSRLFRQLREGASLCYDIDAEQDLFNGVMWVQTGIDFSKKEQAVAMIGDILAALRDQGPTAEELETARVLSLNAIRSVADSPNAIIGMHIRNLTGGQWITLEQMMDAITAVSASDIQAEADRACCDLIYFLRGDAS